MMKKIISIGFPQLGKTLPLGFAAAVPISMISTGSYYIDQCPAENMISIYVTIMGVLSLVRLIISIIMRAKESVGKKVNFWTRIADVILFGLFIAGCVFIYRTKGQFQSHDSGADDYCSYSFYEYSFWVTTATAIVIVLCLAIGAQAIHSVVKAEGRMLIQKLLPVGYTAAGKALPSVLTLAISVSMITMGSFNVDECPAENKISIYLIIMGVLSLLRSVISFVGKVKELEDDLMTKMNRFTRVADVLLFSWFIAGCVFIYRTKGQFQSHDSGADDYCSYSFYGYSFWVTTATGIVLGVSLIFTGAFVHFQMEKERRIKNSNEAIRRRNDLTFSAVYASPYVHAPWFSVTVNVLTVVITAVPISMIVMGVVYKEDCPVERMIHIYLIVMGTLGVLRNMVTIIFRYRDPDGMNDPSVTTYLFLIAIFIWFIVGCVFIYKLKDDFQSHDPEADDFCNYTFYWYSFWVNTVTNGLIVLGIAYLCFLFAAPYICR